MSVISRLTVRAYDVPTETPESDGTLEWDHTTIVVVHARANGQTGLGYAYTHRSAASLISDKLAAVVEGEDALSPSARFGDMLHAIRNFGRPGIVASAIAAVDIALWDLAARIVGLPLATYLGGAREQIPAYGSGGFTSYSLPTLCDQLSSMAAEGLFAVKMKVGREPGRDPSRVRAAREAIGKDVGLFVDANGAYDRKQALALGERFAEQGVTWFEEPVTSDDLDGLRLVRDRAPSGMQVAAGEYGYDPFYFRAMMSARAVDVIQVDATRCLGVSGFLRVAALAEAHNLPLSAHTAPHVHAHLCCATQSAVHVELFHDHRRVEHALFDGAIGPNAAGHLRPDPGAPGLGLTLREPDAERFAR